jgi:hypothetical protein
MLAKSVTKIVLAAALGVASMSPTFAAKVPKPCANPQLRCTAECDKDHWCKVYLCSLNQTVLSPFHCNLKDGSCWQPRC